MEINSKDTRDYDYLKKYIDKKCEKNKFKNHVVFFTVGAIILTIVNLSLYAELMKEVKVRTVDRYTKAQAEKDNNIIIERVEVIENQVVSLREELFELKINLNKEKVKDYEDLH